MQYTAVTTARGANNPKFSRRLTIALDGAPLFVHAPYMKVVMTCGDFAQGVSLPINEHHTVTIKPTATVEVRDAAGAPAVNQPVVVRNPDGTEHPRQTNASGRLFLYSLDPKAKFEVRLNRRSKQIS